MGHEISWSRKPQFMEGTHSQQCFLGSLDDQLCQHPEIYNQRNAPGQFIKQFISFRTYGHGFMCATILHKEYGMLSPWYSIGGYTLAGITGITRQLNNCHWIGDVLVGAGIGMISTDLGYFFSDLIFRKNTTSNQLTTHFNRYDAPSFLSLNMGFATGPSTLRTAELYDTEEGTPLGMHLHTGTSTVVSAEGAYFSMRISAWEGD